MFHSVPESLPENIRHTKLTFRLARAIMKHFNKKTIEKMGDPIMTEYQTVLDHSLAADPTQYFGRDIELDVNIHFRQLQISKTFYLRFQN